jgi:hypothetical protein
VIVSDDFARRHGIATKVRIAAQAMTTDTPSTFASHDMMRLVGWDMTRAAARATYEASGIGPDDLDVVELHDCFAHNELISYEALGLCDGGRRRAIRRRRGQHVRAAGRDESVGGSLVQGPSPGRDAALPNASRSRSSCAAPPMRAGRRRPHRTRAQPGSRRRMRHDAVPLGLAKRAIFAQNRLSCPPIGSP